MNFYPNLTERKKTVLVVEDDPAIKFLCHEILTRKGFEMILFDSGTDAEHYIKNGFNYDLAFLDHHLAGITGFDLAKISKEINPNVKTVCASGGVESRVEQGVFDIVLRKPFQEKGILWALGQAGF